ncbi:BET5 [Auxenochlorella protothecoides x Auxenochlorella symbiontica]|uniref:Trafficking protein particle complex subunit n=1 Tax=Auxenochlorella protothecoides TaxID=3075 RepID=A0A087SGI9_AUXPR|nr:Trafficking protein particle complex subunit 1 [Auxenochlorella protothecoides]KFM24843.1 Trafficking protein particle complex subunit 1 [Auxenochlorella protothecoides]RMZ52721.1 hypothetical protein APUTEX25_000840 [Auxenochlorella protothecoides]|eukprot:RMZ52721.1 hypothetical protein APUTEX25_000840 [Auxenochlorella protothecoides]
MVCFTFYIFNRKGVCQYYHEWSRSKPSREGGSKQEDFKLMFGLFWSMKTFSAAMDPKGTSKPQVGVPMRAGQGCAFRSFRTDKYKLHFMESPSGIKFVLTTDPSVGDMTTALHHIYSVPFVNQVLKNPLYVPGEPFLFESFASALNKYMRTLGLLT